MPKQVSVIYFSGSGHTKKMAEAVASGVASNQGCELHLLEISGDDIQEGRWSNDKALSLLDKSDAIIFGSPTYMGSVAAQMKAFMDATGERYFSQQWRNKLASGFTVSAGPSGDKFNCLTTMAAFAMQQGMIWVGLGLTGAESDGTNRLGCYFGAGAQAMDEPPEDVPNQADKATGYKLGARVAETTLNFKQS